MAFPQQTPLRPLPGAFFHTPAAQRYQAASDPVRRRLFPEGGDGLPLGAGGGSLTGGGGGSAAVAAGSATAALSSGALAPTGHAAGGLVTTGRALPPPENVQPIARAARVINQFLQSDENYPDLDSYCRGESFRHRLLRLRPGQSCP